MRLDLRRFLTLYYGLGTLLFWGIDLVLAAPIRASFIGHPTYRVFYYLALLGLGALCRWRPAAAPAVGMFESAVNLFLVLLSILMPIWGMPDQILGGGAIAAPFGPWTLQNAFLSGCVLIFTFHRSRAALEHQMRTRNRSDNK